jgi:hypothetical protein
VKKITTARINSSLKVYSWEHTIKCEVVMMGPQKEVTSKLVIEAGFILMYKKKNR